MIRLAFVFQKAWVLRLVLLCAFQNHCENMPSELEKALGEGCDNLECWRLQQYMHWTII